MRRAAILAFIPAIALTWGCIVRHNTIATDVDPRHWLQPVGMTFDNQDSLAVLDINLFVRYHRSLESRQLHLQVECVAPDGRSFTEQISLTIPAATKADLAETSTRYRTDAAFSQKGAYHFSISPVSEVSGITAVGMDFTKE